MLCNSFPRLHALPFSISSHHCSGRFGIALAHLEAPSLRLPANMQGLNSSGRKVSLLVEDRTTFGRKSSTSSQGSDAPELSRSCSFDSQTSDGPATPLTPKSAHHNHRVSHATAYLQSPFFEYHPDELHHDGVYMKNSAAYMPSHHESSYPSQSTEREPPLDRKGKRYPCRLAQQFNCDKTFTTSGHASRHAKIHFAVKTIPCTFEGCPKMFTRTDNMKQHLETHYKRMGDKSSRSGSFGHTHSTSSKSGKSREGSEGRRARHGSCTPSLEDDECSSRVESQVLFQPSYDSAHPGSSIDYMSLATLANAARQVEDV